MGNFSQLGVQVGANRPRAFLPGRGVGIGLNVNQGQQQPQQFSGDTSEEEDGGLFGGQPQQPGLHPLIAQRLQAFLGQQRQRRQPAAGIFQNGQGSADILSGPSNQNFNFR